MPVPVDAGFRQMRKDDIVASAVQGILHNLAMSRRIGHWSYGFVIRLSGM